MLAPWPIRLSAHDLAFDALLFCVSQVLITNLWPAAPPLAFSCLTRIFAAARAGSSNGDICPDLSNAQPITTGFFADDAACPPLVAASAAIAVATPRSATSAPHLVARLTAPSSLGKPGRHPGIQAVRAQGVNWVPTTLPSRARGGRAWC